MSTAESSRARRYLLGDVSEDERDAIEQEYFADDRALERMEAAEEELAEDYLANRLGADDRGRFERHYLSAPQHRRRVETIRALTAAGSRTPARASAWTLPRAAIAAAALLAVAAGVWWTSGSGRRSGAVVEKGPVALAPPQVYAVALSPDSVRAGSDSPPVRIPAGTDVLRLQLEGEPNGPKLERLRAVVTRVAGGEVWRGAADDARIEIPAATIRPDDYLVTLFSADASGAEQERYRYFLRVR